MDHRRPEVITVVGTRPEAIKVAPVVLEARRRGHGIDTQILASGQHVVPVTEALATFGLVADHARAVERRTGDLTDLVAALATSIAGVVRERRPAAVLVQGDTASALAGALAAFYARIPVVHLEAGLATPSIERPFPEEAHRRMIAQIAALHLAPTATAADHLRRRGVPDDAIVVTGNTAVDAVLHVLGPANAPRARRGEGPGRVAVVTAHRRESWGAPLDGIVAAVRALVDVRRDLAVVVVLHPNPDLARRLSGALVGAERVTCVPAVAYRDFVHLLAGADVVLTDSGGLQEELPTLGIPAVVLRDETERNEAVAAGFAVLAGTDTSRIVAATIEALDRARPVDTSMNPFGDGRAAARAVDAVRWFLGDGTRPVDFETTSR